MIKIEIYIQGDMNEADALAVEEELVKVAGEMVGDPNLVTASLPVTVEDGEN